MRAPGRYAVILSGILVLFFGAIALLWLGGRTELYFAVMHGLGVDAFTRPFLDLSGVLSMGECHRMGIDVTRVNPCDPLHRLLNYGPPLLHEPFTTADTNVLGLIQSLLFMAALPLVLRPRTWGELGVAVAASLSCAVLYALERGNLDLVEFLLIALGAFLASRGRAGRWGSYLLFYAGGTLKFYPFALLLTIVRERRGAAIGLATLGAAAIADYGFVYHNALAHFGRTLPPFEYNGDVFGAACLPFGLADWLGLPVFAGRALMGALVIGFGVVAWRIARRLQVTLQGSDFDDVNFHLLIAGAIVLTGCFFTGTSISYRGIFLLLILPGLFDLARKAPLRRLAVCAIAVTLLCLWSELLRQWGEAVLDRLLDMAAPMRGDSLMGDAPSIVFFIGRELLWWWLIALLAAVIGVFLVMSRAVRGLRVKASGL